MNTLTFVAKHDDSQARLAISHIDSYRDRCHIRHPDIEIHTRLLKMGERPDRKDVLILGNRYLWLPKECNDSLGWQMGHICLAAHHIHECVPLPLWASEMPFVVIVRNLEGRVFRTSYSQSIVNSYASYAEKNFADAPWGAFCARSQREGVRQWIRMRDKALSDDPKSSGSKDSKQTPDSDS
jgi:hypothetical protein